MPHSECQTSGQSSYFFVESMLSDFARYQPVLSHEASQVTSYAVVAAAGGC